MNTITKIMFATSTAVIMTISASSFAFTGGDGIGGRAWAVEKARQEEERIEARKRAAVKAETKSSNSERFVRGEGIGGRAWIVDQANYQSIQEEHRKKMTGDIRNKADRI